LVSITKIALPLIGIALIGLFFREATAQGGTVASAGQSFGTGFRGFTDALSGMGTSLSNFGSGIGGFITGAVIQPAQAFSSLLGLNANPANSSGSTNPSIGGVITSSTTQLPSSPTASTSSNTTSGWSSSGGVTSANVGGATFSSSGNWGG
tara:strand:- start:589 stop:1041 length:453 start_codon:yes stop_codon:yes gene_type:complete